MWTTFQDQSFLLGAALTTLFHATKFGQLNPDNPITGRYIALIAWRNGQRFCRPLCLPHRPYRIPQRKPDRLRTHAARCPPTFLPAQRSFLEMRRWKEQFKAFHILCT